MKTSSYPEFWSRAYWAFRKRRNYIAATLLFMVISTVIYSNEYRVFREGARQHRRDTSNQRPDRDAQVSISSASDSHLSSHSVSAAASKDVSAAASKDVSAAASKGAVFHRVEQLLTAVDAGAASECPHLFGAGGRCFYCLMKTHIVAGTTDGRKPVCLDFLRPNCTVLSFGINHDFSFEEGMEDLGCVVHAFDPTMGVDSYRRSKGIFYYSVGIGSTDSDMGGFPIASLGSVVRKTRLQTGVIDYLKLDVETSEWETLHQQLTTSGDLLRVRQLNVEFHLFRWSPVIAEGDGMKKLNGSTRLSYEDVVRFIPVLEALKKAGFALVDTFPNYPCQNYDGGCLSWVYDTHWLNRRFNGTYVV